MPISLTPSTPEKGMPRADKIFFTLQAIFGAVFTVGLFALFETVHPYWAVLLIIGGLIGMVATLYERKRGYLRGHLFTVGIAMMILTWLFLGLDCLDRHYHSTDSAGVGRALIVWGTNAGSDCEGTIDGTQLSKWSAVYRVALVCGIQDLSIDRLQDTRITITRFFGIETYSMPVVAPYTEEMRNIVIEHARLRLANLKPAKGKAISFQDVSWYQLILLPTDADSSSIHCLADVTRSGGILLDTGASVFTITANEQGVSG